MRESSMLHATVALSPGMDPLTHIEQKTECVTEEKRKYPRK